MQMEKGEGGRTDIIMESHTKTWIRGCVAVIGQAVIVPERNPGTVAFYWLGAQWGLGPDSTPRPSTGTWQALAGAYLSEVLVQPTRRRLSPVAIPVAAVVAKFNCLLEYFSSFVSYFLSLPSSLSNTCDRNARPWNVESGTTTLSRPPPFPPFPPFRCSPHRPIGAI